MIPLVNLWTGELECVWVALLRELVYHHTAWIPKAIVLRNLVKSLSNGIVYGGSKDLHAIIAVYTANDGVATGKEDSKIRVLKRMLYLRGIEMRPYVVYSNERDLENAGHALCKIETNKERPQKTRS